MSYTGKEIFDMSIAVIDELSDAGTVSESQIKEYQYRAPFLLDMWQHEMQKVENITNLVKITNLNQTLQVSEPGCISGVYYLASHFALADQNSELAGICQAKFMDLKREARKPLPAVAITDYYSTSG